MIEQLQSPGHVVGIRLAGKISAEDVNGIKPALEKALAANDEIGVVVDMSGFEDASAEAIAADVKYEMSLMAKIGQFRRAAFIADKEWLQAVTGFVGSLIPTMQMKVFSPGEQEKAIAWASEIEEMPASSGEALSMIHTDRDDVFGFQVDGVMTAENVRPLTDKVAAILANHDKVRLLARVKSLGGIDPAVFMQSGLISMKFAAVQKVERYAIVGAPEWMRTAVATMNPMFPHLEIRSFDAEDEGDAWAWLGASPTS